MFGLNVTVVGAGGLGGYYGGRLALSGVDVSFLTRTAHPQLGESGMKVLSGDSTQIAKVRASTDPRELGEADVVLFCVKTYDTEAAARMAIPLVGSGTTVLTL